MHIKKLLGLLVIITIVSLIPRPPIQGRAHAQTPTAKQTLPAKISATPQTQTIATQTFDPLRPETWPKCADNEFVRADNGQCDKKPAESPVVAQTASYSVADCGDPHSIMAAAGVSESNWGAVNYIVTHEGGWCGATRWNEGGSGAYGICQSLPAAKMASAGDDWQTNPVTQLRWCDSYASSRYGGWWNAYSYWTSHGNW